MATRASTGSGARYQSPVSVPDWIQNTDPALCLWEPPEGGDSAASSDCFPALSGLISLLQVPTWHNDTIKTPSRHTPMCTKPVQTVRSVAYDVTVYVYFSRGFCLVCKRKSWKTFSFDFSNFFRTDGCFIADLFGLPGRLLKLVHHFATSDSIKCSTYFDVVIAGVTVKSPLPVVFHWLWGLWGFYHLALFKIALQHAKRFFFK